MSNYNINKPSVKDDWVIFPNSIFSNLETMDCNDSIEGICYNDKTLNQCISLCEKSPECDYGYYINKNIGQNICVPLKKHNNPIHRLRKKDIYPILDNATTKVFINKNIYDFPPKDANTLFFMDNFNIQNVETGMILETSPISHKKNKQDVQFTKNGDLIVQILQVPPDLSAGIQYVPVKYGDPIALNIPNTTLIMRENSLNDHIEWVPRSEIIPVNMTFKLIPITNNKKIGDTVSFSDTFCIYSNVYILGIDNQSMLEKLYYNTYDQAIDKKENVTFRFYPKMKGWYCDKNNNGKCTEIPLSKMKINNKGIAMYNGSEILRNPGCFGTCSKTSKGRKHIIMIVFFLIIISVILLIKFV